MILVQGPLAQASSPGGAVLIAIALLFVSLPILVRQANLARDRRLFGLMVFALMLRLGAAVVHYYFAFDVYGGTVDASRYHSAGVAVSEAFRSGGFHVGYDIAYSQVGSAGTQFIGLLTGIVYTFIGPNTLGGFIVFSWISFWGVLFFYRAFLIAVREGSRKTYAGFLFFLPSLIFWPSTIGKEAWVLFSLGLAVYGCALVLSGRTWHGIVVAALGLCFTSLARIHLAAIVGLALVVAYLIRRPRMELRQLAPVAKGAMLIVLAVVGTTLVIETGETLRQRFVEPDRGFGAVFTEVGERTGRGGSAFEPVAVTSPLQFPLAAFTVLYRPLPIEANNAPAFFAALESTFLFLLLIVRFRWFTSAVRRVRKPFVAFAITYVILFIVGVSSFANFGLLARQRVQLLSLFLVLFAIPPRVRALRSGGMKEEPERDPELVSA